MSGVSRHRPTAKLDHSVDPRWVLRRQPKGPGAADRRTNHMRLFETQRVEGHWRHGATLYRDTLVRLVIDVPDSATNRAWMKAFKRRWKVKLEQLELWMVSYLITVE